MVVRGRNVNSSCECIYLCMSRLHNDVNLQFYLIVECCSRVDSNSSLPFCFTVPKDER